MDKELNQLYALFAVRVGNIPPALIKGLYTAWEEDPAAAMPARATQSGVVRPEQSAMLVSMVKQAVQSHGGDAAKALRELGGAKAVQGALAGASSGGVGDRLGAWATPIAAASAAVAFLAIVVMGSGWYSAASARTTMQRNYQQLEDSVGMLQNEVAHLKHQKQLAEEDRQQAVRALAMAEEDLADERRRRREMAARLQDDPLPPPPSDEPETIPAPDAPIQPLPWQRANAQQTQQQQQPVNINRRQLERQAGNLNADTVINQLRPDFARDANGRVLGLTSQNFSSIPIARQLGLQNGDVIANINGVNVTGLGSYGAIEQAVQRGGPITVTILRNGQPLTASFNLR